MTAAELKTHLGAYQSGLEAELAILRQLEQLSADQNRAMFEHDDARLRHVADERGRLMASLVHLESQIARSRQLLAEYRSIASTLPGFEAVAALHRTASAIVNAIIGSDRDTMLALRDAEAARRVASQAIEAGEHTLAAYRRVLSPAVTGPSLVDRHG
jgi:hypothetical protein